MPLPHFSSYALNSFTPIHKNRFEINIENDILNNYCFKIEDKYIWFHLNVIDNEIVPINYIKKLIDEQKELNIEISIISNDGEILTCIYLENVVFLKINNFIDFDFNNDSDILDIKVKYKCENQKTFNGLREIINYRRIKKIEKINQL